MNEREELAGIVAGLRRVLARAGASDGELIVRAQREPRRTSASADDLVPVGPAADPMKAILDAPASHESEGVGSARVDPPVAPERRPIREQSLVTPAVATSSRETTTPADEARDLAESFVPEPAATVEDLFGPPKPAFVFQHPTPSAVAPRSFDLNPAGTEARAALLEASLPILEQVAGEVCGCTKCGLSGTRTRAVPGTGSAKSGIVFVGEAPGAEEDRQGKPFVGRAGELLTKMIQAMEAKRLLPGVPLDRETVYICNVLKCRPPENRNPLPHEVEACSPYLMRQLEALQPRVICCLGKFAAELLLGIKGTIAGMRGRVYRWRGSKLIVTYHPAACLRNPNLKGPVWEDLQLLAREYQAD